MLLSNSSINVIHILSKAEYASEKNGYSEFNPECKNSPATAGLQMNER